jgi:release factor glutamine methyltransferase
LERLDAQLLLLHALGKAPHDRAWLLAHDSDGLAPQVQQRFEALVRRRQDAEPVAYILGHKEFFGLQLAVDPSVLIPRPETELLVDWALALLQDAAPKLPLRVLDLGTGSGAVALALKHTQPQLQVHAVDVSAAALAVAQHNAKRLQLPITFGQGHWFEALGQLAASFDLIVSNPPYIAEQDPHLAALAHEPALALRGGADGLRDLCHIVAQAPNHLRPGGWLLLEHGHDQAAAVRLALGAANFQAIESRRDISGMERCTGARWAGVRTR